MFLSSNTHITLPEHLDYLLTGHPKLSVKDIVKVVGPHSQAGVKNRQPCSPYISSFSRGEDLAELLVNLFQSCVHTFNFCLQIWC